MMISFIDIGADNVVAMKISGKVSAREYEQVVTQLEKKIQDFDDVRIYAELEDFERFSAEAFFKDIKFAVSNWGRFNKEALVTEKRWLKKALEIANDLFSEIEVKSFPLSEKDRARRWVCR